MASELVSTSGATSTLECGRTSADMTNPAAFTTLLLLFSILILSKIPTQPQTLSMAKKTIFLSGKLFIWTPIGKGNKKRREHLAETVHINTGFCIRFDPRIWGSDVLSLCPTLGLPMNRFNFCFFHLKHLRYKANGITGQLLYVVPTWAQLTTREYLPKNPGK